MRLSGSISGMVSGVGTIAGVWYTSAVDATTRSGTPTLRPALTTASAPRMPDVEHEFRSRVEVFGAVDRREVHHHLGAFERALQRILVTHVAREQLDVGSHLGEPAGVATHHGVDHRDVPAVGDQPLDQIRADESAAAGDDYALSHRLAIHPLRPTAKYESPSSEAGRWLKWFQ